MLLDFVLDCIFVINAQMVKGWEAGFKSAVRQNRRGWNVHNNNGRMILILRGKDIQTQNVNLPYYFGYK